MLFQGNWGIFKFSNFLKFQLRVFRLKFSISDTIGRQYMKFSLEDGLKDDLKNISLFCRANGPNLRPDDESLLWKLSNRWGIKGYGQILNDDDVDDLSDWKYWFTALSIICGMIPYEKFENSFLDR